MASSRKRRYKVAVYATYVRTVEVEGISPEDAEELVSCMWAEEKISMCPHDPGVGFDDVEFSSLGVSRSKGGG